MIPRRDLCWRTYRGRWTACTAGIGCYMFRLDRDRIIDATFSGNAARYINHSCAVRTAWPTWPSRTRSAWAALTRWMTRGGARATPQPNCFARYLSVDGEKHVVIVAKERIAAGDELAYDYHMPYEAVKIPCRCGAPTCRKHMN